MVYVLYYFKIVTIKARTRTMIPNLISWKPKPKRMLGLKRRELSFQKFYFTENTENRMRISHWREMKKICISSSHLCTLRLGIYSLANTQMIYTGSVVWINRQFFHTLRSLNGISIALPFFKSFIWFSPTFIVCTKFPFCEFSQFKAELRHNDSGVLTCTWIDQKLASGGWWRNTVKHSTYIRWHWILRSWFSQPVTSANCASRVVPLDKQ